jgi:hypothetical protein
VGEPFVLELAENPHPRMLAAALSARADARAGGKAATYWAGYLTAMVDATGEDPKDIEAWMDRQEATGDLPVRRDGAEDPHGDGPGA